MFPDRLVVLSFTSVSEHSGALVVPPAQPATSSSSQKPSEVSPTDRSLLSPTLALASLFKSVLWITPLDSSSDSPQLPQPLAELRGSGLSISCTFFPSSLSSLHTASDILLLSDDILCNLAQFQQTAQSSFVIIRKPEIPPTPIFLIIDDLSDASLRLLHSAVEISQRTYGRLLIAHFAESRNDSSPSPADDQHDRLNLMLNDRLARTDFRTIPGGVRTTIHETSLDSELPNIIRDYSVDFLILTPSTPNLPHERFLPNITCNLWIVPPVAF